MELLTLTSIEGKLEEKEKVIEGCFPD